MLSSRSIIMLVLLLGAVALKCAGQTDESLAVAKVGGVVVRDSADIGGGSLHVLKQDEVFFVDWDYNASFPESEWADVTVFSDSLTKSWDAAVRGYIRLTELTMLDSLELVDTGKPFLIFESVRADTLQDISGFAYGLGSSLKDSYEIERMELFWQGHTQRLEAVYYDDLFNVYSTVGISTSEAGRVATMQRAETTFIYQAASDGSGSYHLVWVIRNGQIIQRLAGNLY